MKQFIEFSEKTKEKLKIYEGTLKKWQKKINLISPSTVSEFGNVILWIVLSFIL